MHTLRVLLCLLCTLEETSSEYGGTKENETKWNENVQSRGSRDTRIYEIRKKKRERGREERRERKRKKKETKRKISYDPVKASLVGRVHLSTTRREWIRAYLTITGY